MHGRTDGPVEERILFERLSPDSLGIADATSDDVSQSHPFVYASTPET